MFNVGNESVAASEIVAATEPKLPWTEAEVAVLLRSDVIANVVSGGCSASGEMTALCVGIGDDIILTAVTAATTYIYTTGIDSTTAGRTFILAAGVCPHIHDGGGVGGVGGTRDVGGGAGGGVGSEVPK